MDDYNHFISVCMYVLHTTFVLAANILPFYCGGYKSRSSDESISDDIIISLLQVRNACMRACLMYYVCIFVMYVCTTVV